MEAGAAVGALVDFVELVREEKLQVAGAAAGGAQLADEGLGAANLQVVSSVSMVSKHIGSQLLD